ncbi:MAG: 5-formyltetrahydrofolate cyclo-ligase [Proteobacteria bacterium]|nr:5-formyltetrahydrofolate cyclo-ligase [Pseudomonadota bacterium]
MSDMDGKGEIRKRILALRNALPPELIAVKSGEIVRRLTGLREIRDSSTLMVFLSFGSEVLTDDLIRWGWEEGKRIVVPLCRPEGRELTPCRIDGFAELEAGHYGIREPKADRLRIVPPGEIDAVLVPAVAFDRRGYRVGYGGGYYDRFLPKVPQAAKIGAAFACQIVPEVPIDSYDVQVERIATEEGIIIPEDERRLLA